MDSRRTTTSDRDGETALEALQAGPEPLEQVAGRLSEVDYRHDLQHGGWATGVTLAAPLYRIEGFGKLMRLDGRVIRIAES